MICPTCAGALTPFGHGYLECGECDAVFVNDDGKLVDVSFCKPEIDWNPDYDIIADMRQPLRASDAIYHTAETVKRPDLFGHVHDTYATETELNGFRPTQGALI